MSENTAARWPLRMSAFVRWPSPPQAKTPDTAQGKVTGDNCAVGGAIQLLPVETARASAISVAISAGGAEAHVRHLHWACGWTLTITCCHDGWNRRMLPPRVTETNPMDETSAHHGPLRHLEESLVRTQRLLDFDSPFVALVRFRRYLHRLA